MRVQLDIPDAEARANARRAWQDPQVRHFVLTVGRLLRKSTHRDSLARFVEAQLYGWRHTPGDGRPQAEAQDRS